MGFNYKTKDGRPSLRVNGARHLSWCKAKYPYTDECWSAEHGRIINRFACQNCELNNSNEPRKRGRGDANFY